MAERGVDDDNPFSFKAFVNVKDKKTTKTGNSLFYDSDDIFDTKDQSLGNISSKKENLVDKPSTLSLSTTTTTTKTNVNGVTVKKDQPKDNPFSFKKFLSSSSSKTKKVNDPTLTQKTRDIKSDDIFQEESSSFEAKPDTQSKSNRLLTAAPVVDFNADLIPVNPTNSRTFDLLAESNPDASSKAPLGEIHDLQIPFLEEEEVDLSLPIHDNQHKLPLALPDFLSDGAAMKFPGDAKDGIHSEEELLERIKNLEDENTMLRKELSRERQINNEKNQRLKQLTLDLEKQKKKEAEETAVLEKAVQQVEENLVTTTKRAVQAEANVTLLKKENKMLQGQVNSLLQMNESFKSGDKGLADIKERTKYTSEQLLSASVVAEKNIKELMAGVDKLKLLSQVLASIDKISDGPTDTSPEQDKT